ncbi:hypothetical protein [uncultured Jatrophihabitans sp.]|uniref:hypothetical protein n=1 Tax=uncultured Jatrophihabitans sp. TaxID=1610747 RepID=UPI0035C97645
MFVSDDVWRSIDTTSARVPRPVRIRMAGVVAAAAVLIGAVLYAGASGLLIHRLAVTSVSTDGEDSTCTQVVTVANRGWFAEHVGSQRLLPDATGARLVRPLARTIPSGGHGTLRLSLDAAFCRHVEFANTSRAAVGAPRLILHLHRPWGTSSDTLMLRQPHDQDGLTVNW